MTVALSEAQVPGDLDERSFMGRLGDKACFRQFERDWQERSQ